jgi:hypothetical protein
LNVILILGGPSGAGKSALGHYLETNCAFIHYEFDQFGITGESGEPPDVLGIRDEWNNLYSGDSGPMLEMLAGKSAVITIPGMPWFIQGATIAQGVDVRVRYLVGPAKICLEEFERRERETGRGLPSRLWRENKPRIFLALALGDIPTDWCVPAFNDTGVRKPYSVSAKEVCG